MSDVWDSNRLFSEIIMLSQENHPKNFPHRQPLSYVVQ